MRSLAHIAVVATAAWIAGAAPMAWSQEVSFSDQRPFVVGVIPIVGGGGAVGGVAIDARGAVEQADERDIDALRDYRRAALAGAAGDVAAPSRLRKISLRRLDALLAELALRGESPPEVLYLAGLTRVEYVFAYPELGDVVLAGPAEGWAVDDAGNVVGATSGAAVLQLVDLIAALRTIDRLLAGELISCSIDPTPAGLQRFARLARDSRAAVSAQLLRRMEQAVGPQTITLTGIAPTSHFAQVLVAADWQMKRLAMGLAASPAAGLPSYLELLDEAGAAPQSALPRWWIAFGSSPVERDAAGLAWRLSPPGLEVRTAAARLEAGGRVATQAATDPLAQQWADAMTEHYDELALAEPVFGQLRGCMDLALATAVLASSDLLSHASLPLPMLREERRLKLAEHPVPRTVASQASAVRVRRSWVVSVSGGVELDVGRAVNAAIESAETSAARSPAAPGQAKSWWWD
jgi:hypothetical protein